MAKSYIAEVVTGLPRTRVFRTYVDLMKRRMRWKEGYEMFGNVTSVEEQFLLDTMPNNVRIDAWVQALKEYRNE